MFELVDFNDDIETIISRMEKNCSYAETLRRQIRELKASQKRQTIEEVFTDEQRCVELPPREEEIEEEDFIAPYIEDYRRLDGDDIDSLRILLPSRDDYQYERVILRLQAESVREIKEMTEILLEEEEENKKEMLNFIQNEKKKILLLKQLLQEEEEQVEGKKEENNHIILAATKTGKVRILDDIESIPQDFYDEIYDLINSIIKGTFKGIKRFNIGSNEALGGITEVRGAKARILFQRLNSNTYALFAAFIKKTTNDRGYQGFLKTRISDYKEVEDKIKACIENPEFLEANEELVQELWNQLGHGTSSKDSDKKLRKE